MKLLVLGGTVFLGRHIVEVALAHHDEVTLFNRGQPPGEWSPLRQAASARAGSGTGVAGAAATSCAKLSHC